MTRPAASVLRCAHLLLAWSLSAAADAADLGAQGVDAAAYEHLVEPRIVERADERVLEVRAVGDPDEVGGAAFGLLFQLYFSSGATTGFTPPVARARWQDGLDRIPRGEWIERLKAFVEAEGHETVGGHEEEYVPGPTMAGPRNPDEYRTILRYLVITGAGEPTG